MQDFRHGYTEITFTPQSPGDRTTHPAFGSVAAMAMHPADSVRAAAAQLPAGWTGTVTFTDGRHSSACGDCKHWKPYTLAVGATHVRSNGDATVSEFFESEVRHG